MITTLKVKLHPNNKQRSKLFAMAGVSRWAYNWTLGRQKKNYDLGNKLISDNELRKELTQLKKTQEYSWLNNYSNNVTKQAIKDACESYKRFFNGRSQLPRLKSKKRSKPSFYQANDKIKFTTTHVKLEKLASSTKKNKTQFNWIRLAEKDRIPLDATYSNPRVSFDGLDWWLTVGVEIKTFTRSPINQGIGIDVGVKDLAICSDGNSYENINKSSTIKKIEKKKRRLQRQINRKYILNKKGGSYCKTSNIKKKELELLRLTKRLTNIRINYTHQVTTEIVNRKPMFITIEDLNVKGMMKNKHLAKRIAEQRLHDFKRVLIYKAKRNLIELRQVSRWYPSSKTCNACGLINSELKLSDRVFKCKCGYRLDRDLNASLNLEHAKEYKVIA